MFRFNRDLAVSAIDWSPEPLYYLEAWSFPEATTATPWNFRSGTLRKNQIEEWLHQTGSFSVPTPPASVGRPAGGIRLLACDYTLFQKACLGLSREAFEMVESVFDLHPATLPSLEVSSGTFSRHFQKVAGENKKFSIILKAPQKYEIGNYMLSLTHDMTSHWTTALLAGESIVYGVNEVDNITDIPLEILSPCAIIQSYLMLSTALWTSPLTLPCIILTHHLKRLQQQCREDLTRQVIRIEEQLGVTGVGRRNIGVGTSSTSGRISKNFRGKPVERAQAEFLTVKINTELTRLLFTGHAPKWNYKASELLLGLINEMEVRYEVLSSHEISDMLEHNIILAQSLEDHLLGLQKRLELQLDVLYSFVAQSDNRISARLAATSGRDSTSMKILAFITTIFLPGTYVATLFSMNMFNWEQSVQESSDVEEPTVSSRFWIYWAVSAPLTALTIAGWGIWWSFEKHRYDEHIQDTITRADEIHPPPWWRRLLRSREILGSWEGSFDGISAIGRRDAGAHMRGAADPTEPHNRRQRRGPPVPRY